jgi:predicted N-acetyltransferase YhbS
VGNTYPIFLLGPVSVILEHRKQGVGAQLIEQAFHLARIMGYSTVLSSYFVVFLRI